MQKTMSEQFFEDYCARRGIVCQRVPECETQTPDYELVFGDVRVIVEVKEITPNKEEQESDRVCLVKSPFLLPSLMLRPIVDTLHGDDLRSSLAPADRPRTGPVARRAAP
jgi:hypothetical protein